MNTGIVNCKNGRMCHQSDMIGERHTLIQDVVMRGVRRTSAHNVGTLTHAFATAARSEGGKKIAILKIFKHTHDGILCHDAIFHPLACGHHPPKTHAHVVDYPRVPGCGYGYPDYAY